MGSLYIINDLVQSLLLPELKQDLDSIPIEREHFDSYHQLLVKHLPLLYDCIKKRLNNVVCNTAAFEGTEQEVPAFLIILLCEISSPNLIFKLRQNELIHNAEMILQNHINLTKEVDDLIFKYYEEKLQRDKWKRQLGAVHGFIKYLEVRFSSVCDLEQIMSRNCIMFCLSVALNIRSCYDTNYKTLSTIIFITMLRQGNRDDIVSMNIHGVIYDAVFKDVCILDSIDFIAEQWNCLIKCLDFYDNFDSFSWSYLDDMMETLLRNISLSSDSATSICLLKFVNKLIVYFTIDHKEFDEFFNKDLSLVVNISDCRSLAITNTSYTCYRWAKHILQMFNLESYRLMQTSDVAKQMLQEIHKIYILAVLPIRLPIVHHHLHTFLEKFIPVVLEIIKVNKYQEEMMKIITSLIETFYFHLQSSEGFAQLENFKLNIYELLKTEVFEKYTSI